MREVSRTVDFGVAVSHLTKTIVEHAEATADAVMETIPVIEETLRISKRQVVTGRVRVSTRTETHDEVAEATLDRNVVDVTRLPIGTFVDVSPAVRTQGDTIIVPVLEERLVTVKRLFLVEELHIRHHVEREVVSETVALRRQLVTIERLDSDGGVLGTPATKD